MAPPMATTTPTTTLVHADGATATGAATGASEAAEKAQAFAHRVIEFAEFEKCCRFFDEKQVDFDKPTIAGWTILMSVVASARVDLIGLVMDRTSNVESGTIPNGATVLHMAATSSNPQVIQHLAGTEARIHKLQAIANACNRNGDTPLMMACVAKNVAAVQILLEQVHAFPSPGNSSGMTALMCASRLQDDEHDGEPSTGVAESDAIVALLLANGANVNATTKSPGNQTALHVALDSCNVSVIQQLIAVQEIDLTVRNKAGDTPLALAKRLKLGSLMDSVVASRRHEMEEQARQMGETVAEQLADAVWVGKKQPQQPKKKKTHKKQNNGNGEKPRVDKKDAAADISQEKKEEDEVVEDMSTPSVSSVLRRQQDDDVASDDAWVTATAKKTKRKESSAVVNGSTTTASVGPKAKSKTTTKTQNHPQPHTAKPQPQPAKVPPPTSKPPPTAQPAEAKPQTTSAWASAPPRPAAQTAAHGGPPTPPSPSASASAAAPTQDELTAIFHRMFPIANEMDVPVESFLVGAATPETANLLSGLSVSQVEILQEAHLQAYQFLNERKIELVRVLETQRLEEQMELRRQILELP